MKIFASIFRALVTIPILVAALAATEASGRGHDNPRQALSMVPGDRLGIYRLSTDGAESLEKMGKPAAIQSGNSEAGL